jgi:tetratricopeptide (TPR) repeat protein
MNARVHDARAIAAAALLLGATCGGDAVSAGSAPPSAASSRPAASAPASANGAPSASAAAPVRHRRTTSPSIALANLQDKITTLERITTAKPRDLPARRRRVMALLERGQTLGRPKDLAKGLAIALATDATKGDNLDAHAVALLHASALGAVHRFDDAAAKLVAADAMTGARARDTERHRAALAAARGDLATALELARAVRGRRADIGILTLEGKILAEMGQIDEAMRTFDAAEASYRDPSPFPLADLHLERGLAWEARGELDRAKEAYRAALERLPQHAHAALHLAPLLVPKEGVALLERLLRTSEDPEVRGRLGELRELVAKGSGEADVAAAAAAYEQVLEQLPEAYADHAAWFWLGPGRDAARAWTWAQRNLAIRPDARALELALAAARAAERPRGEVCALATRARAYAWPTPRLREAIAASGCT